MLTTFTISSEELRQLNYERYHYPCPIVQKRLHCLYLKATTDYSNEQIGLWMGAHRNSISGWIQLYKQGGFERIVQLNYGTNKSDLEVHTESLLQSFSQQPSRSLDEAVLRTEELTGIRRSASRMRAFLLRHGFHYLKTGHVPAKADTDRQKQWVKTMLEPAIQAAKEGQIHLLFLDAAHFTLQPFLCCLWCMARVFIKASPGRNRINVLGAINALTKEVSVFTNTTYICASSIVAFLKQLKEQYNDKPIAIVLDNARYQHCFEVKAIAAGLGIHLLFLPPYSPNLNIIERLWKFTKKEILNARYYDNPDAFHKAITFFFQNINQTHHQKLHALMSLKFQFFDQNIAHSYAT